MYNHKVDERSDVPFGHFTNSVVMDGKPLPGWENVYTVPGWYYEADIDPEETDILRKLKRGDLRHVSIQLLGEDIQERLGPNGPYTEATVGDIIEGSIVPAPGFLDTTCTFAESLNKKHKEEVSTSTGAGAIAPAKLPEDEKKTEAVNTNQLSEGAKVETEHKPTYDKISQYLADNGKLPEPEMVYEWIAADHIAEIPDYYPRLKKMEEEAKAQASGGAEIKKEQAGVTGPMHPLMEEDVDASDVNEIEEAFNEAMKDIESTEKCK
jgi:hypothetical protein